MTGSFCGQAFVQVPQATQREVNRIDLQDRVDVGRQLLQVIDRLFHRHGRDLRQRHPWVVQASPV